MSAVQQTLLRRKKAEEPIGLPRDRYAVIDETFSDIVLMTNSRAEALEECKKQRDRSLPEYAKKIRIYKRLKKTEERI